MATRHARGVPGRRRPAALLVLLLALSGAAGCGGKGAEGITEVNEAFESGDAESVTGQERTVEGEMPAVDQDDPVRVTGIVGEFGIAEVERELGVELPETLYEEYEGGPYIRARRIAEDVELD